MLIGIDASRATSGRPTGTEVYCRNLIQHLIQGDGRHRYRLYFNQAPASDDFPTAQNVEVQVIPFPRLWTHLRLSLEMVLHPPDLLFIPAHVLPVIHPPRSVVTVHDLGYLHFPQAHPPLARLYLDLSTRYNVRQASLVMADSQATKDDLIQKYKASAQRITVVYPGYNEGFRPVRDPALLRGVREKYGISQRYILYLGTVQPRKNVQRLIRAHARLRDGPQLVVAGRKGWLSQEIYREAQRQGQQSKVLFADYVSPQDLPALMSGAELFVLPSLYEGFGLPVLEAQACGTPVVCSNTSSLPEVAGEGAILVDPLDLEALTEAMERLLVDEALRGQLIERGLENVKRFSWERCARETLQVLEGAGSG